VLPAQVFTPKADFVVSRLRQAGWISGHRFEPGRGYVLKWEGRGRQKAAMFQELIKRYRLEDGKRALKFWSRNLDLDPLENELPTLLEHDFWRMCLEELGIRRDEESLASLTQTIAVWEPQFWPPGV